MGANRARDPLLAFPPVPFLASITLRWLVTKLGQWLREGFDSRKNDFDDSSEGFDTSREGFDSRKNDFDASKREFEAK